MHERFAPGGPGDPPEWGEARKDDIGTAVGEVSRVWFTLARGRLDEVYYPTPDRACVRALGFAIAGPSLYEDESAEHVFTRPDEQVPLVSIESRHRGYRMVKETIADPRSAVVLQHVRWRSSRDALLYALLEPHLDNTGHNTGVVAEHLGHTVLAAEHGGVALALACSVPWQATSAGFAGSSGGRAQLRDHGRLRHCYQRAEHGNVVMTGAVEDDDFVLALAFADSIDGAAHLAAGALARGYSVIRAEYVDEWRRWHENLTQRPSRPLWRRSACVLKTLEAKHVDGGRVAALGKPWGQHRGEALSGAYHLVWTRDLVQSMGALVAAGAHGEARRAVTFLQITQRPDGRWPQNMLLDGRRVWRRDELDETALPILLIELMRREEVLDDEELARAWPMVERAARYLVSAGPSTTLDRWEDTGGLTPFTLASETAALATAAALGRELGEPCDELDEVAARWDAAIERWLYRRGGPLADRLGIAGYYVRARRPGEPFAELELPYLPPTELSPDALALVRFGLRAPDDPRIVDTVRAIDAVLRTTCGGAPAWHRYPGDHYGEHRDGAPFDGHGIGRAWPLLVGERAHYELACGHRERAEALLHAMERFASPTGMLPEQVWDAPDRDGLHEGQPTHSAAPLGWSHTEYVKLCRSLADGRVFDLPDVLVRRSSHAMRAAPTARPGDRAR